MAKHSYCFCPECKKWVPSESMNYFDDIRVCHWCLNQIQEQFPHNKFVHEPNYGKVQCIMCDSYETEHIAGTQPRKYKCTECGEEFIL